MAPGQIRYALRFVYTCLTSASCIFQGCKINESQNSRLLAHALKLET